tara:strand:- start:556 stop:987 length:432 start_codon:yes stop_codon:yes gene_type:complete
MKQVYLKILDGKIKKKQYLMKNRKVYFFFIALCILQLFYLLYHRSDFKFTILKNSFNINSGKTFAVSPEVIESNNILINNKINNFNMSKKLKNDTYFYQRFVEFNYPIRIKINSKYIFFLIDEEITNDCILHETGVYLKIAKC